MITIDNALKILNKYGYSSKTVHPFLYINNKDVGINYSYIDDKYGITERIAIFHSTQEMDNFLKKLQWFKLNGKQKDVKLKLNNYEISNPEILLIRNNHVMTDDEIFNIDAYDRREEKNRQLSHTKRLLLEVESLMDRYYLEKNKQFTYINNFNKKQEELRRYNIELNNLIKRYNRKDNLDIYTEKEYKIKQNLTSESIINERIAKYNNKLESEKEIYNLLNDVWNLNKQLETNKDYMNALRHNDDIDEEMRLTITKIDYLKELLTKKRTIFNKVNIDKQLKSIDSQSTYVSLYDDNFENKYKDFINKKYDGIKEINEFRLCEYLNDFKSNKEYDIKRNIMRCKNEVGQKIESYFTDHNLIYNDLNKQFEKLTPKERNSLILYSSIYYDLFETIMDINDFDNISISKLISILNITNGFNLIYDNCYTNIKKLLELKENKNIKDTLFKYINFDNKNMFLESIKESIKVLFNINDKLILKYNTHLYYGTNDFDNFDKKRLIRTSMIISPYMSLKTNNYKTITFNVNKGINVLYSPYTVKLPLSNAYNKEIELLNINSDIIIDTSDIKMIKDNNTIIYSKFKSNLVNSENYSYVDKFDLNYKININKIFVEKRITNE